MLRQAAACLVLVDGPLRDLGRVQTMSQGMPTYVEEPLRGSGEVSG